MNQTNPCPTVPASAMFKPPAAVPETPGLTRVFLGGSIDMGQAEDWQALVAADLADLPVAFLNPRREHWDAGWVQDISNPEFRGQVQWELDGLESSDLVLFHLSPSGPAPVTLMELGLHARTPDRCIVSCPAGYWRRGNVQVLCARFGITLVDSLDSLVWEARARIVRRSGGTPRSLHREAMDTMDAVHGAEGVERTALLRRAARLEASAAALMPNDADTALSRAVLLRSAATLANQAGERDRAVALALRGLIDMPHGEIAAELREVLSEAMPNGTLAAEPA